MVKNSHTAHTSRRFRTERRTLFILSKLYAYSATSNERIEWLSQSDSKVVA